MEDELVKLDDVALIIDLDREELEGRDEPPGGFVGRLTAEGWRVFCLDDDLRVPRLLTGESSQDEALKASRHAVLLVLKAERALSVCFFSHSASLNGAERTLLDLVRFSVSEQDVLTTVVLPGSGPLEGELRSAGAGCLTAGYHWWCSSSEIDEQEIRARLLSSAVAILEEIVPALERIRPDVVVTNSLVIPWGAVAAALLRRPHVWYVTEFGERDHGFHFFEPFDEVIDFVRRSSDLILTVSDAVREELFGDLPEQLCRTEYPYLKPPSAQQPAPRTYFLREGAFRLGNFHTLTEGKGQESAVLAVAELTCRGHEVELLLAGGSDEGYHRRIEELVERLSLGDRVHLEGFLEDPYPAMQQCNVVVLCSRQEAFGRLALEGALLGKPIVYSATGGYLESMRDRETGLSYSAGDEHELADCIEDLLRDRDLTEVLGRRARDHARQFVSGLRPDLRFLPSLRALADVAAIDKRASLPMVKRLTSLRRFLLLQRQEAAVLQSLQGGLQQQADSLLGVTSRLDALEDRLRSLSGARTAAERQPGRPEVALATEEGSKRVERLVHHLQDSIDHVASETARLRRDLATVVTMLEERRDGGESFQFLGRSDSPGFEWAGRIFRGLVRSARRLLRPGYRAARSLAGRTRRAVLRQLPSRFTGDAIAGDELRLTAGRPRPVSTPALSVVIPVDGLSERESQALREELDQQTATNLEWVLWHAGAGRLEILDRSWRPISTAQALDSKAVRKALRGVYAATAGPGSAVWSATWLETAI